MKTSQPRPLGGAFGVTWKKGSIGNVNLIRAYIDRWWTQSRILKILGRTLEGSNPFKGRFNSASVEVQEQ